MYTCIHTYIHTYVRTYIHTYMHTYIHTYIHHTYIQTDRQTNVYKHARAHTHAHTHTHSDYANLKRSGTNFMPSATLRYAASCYVCWRMLTYATVVISGTDFIPSATLTCLKVNADHYQVFHRSYSILTHAHAHPTQLLYSHVTHKKFKKYLIRLSDVILFLSPPPSPLPERDTRILI